MKKPLYTKIPGSELTADQYTQVIKKLAPKYGPKFPSELKDNVFYFRGEVFLEVWS